LKWIWNNEGKFISGAKNPFFKCVGEKGISYNSKFLQSNHNARFFLNENLRMNPYRE
jgi:hypothetical protein